MSYGEYKFYRLKPKSMTINAYRADIEEQSVELTLSAGKTYYLRIKSFSDDFGKFDITRVNSRVAYKALNETSLAGEYETTQAIVSDLIIEDKPEAAVTTTTVIHSKSKTDELLSAAKLKEQGLLTDEEFNKLKSEILAR